MAPKEEKPVWGMRAKDHGDASRPTESYLVSTARCAVLDESGNVLREVAFGRPFEIQIRHDRGMGDAESSGSFVPGSGIPLPQVNTRGIVATGTLSFSTEEGVTMEFDHVGNPEDVRNVILKLALLEQG